MEQRAFSDDPATERFLAARAADGTEDVDGEPVDDSYPSHWVPRTALAGALADLPEDELLTTINAALLQRRGR